MTKFTRYFSILLMFCLVLVCNILFAHPWKPLNYIIVDTDGGIDDMRCLTLMLSSDNIRVLAITTSNGVIDANLAATKVKQLLNSLSHQGILVGVNNNLQAKINGCTAAVKYNWGEPVYNSDTLNFISVINHVLANTNEQVSFVNLGSLNTIDNYIDKYPNAAKRFKNIYWLSHNNYKQCFNFFTDTISANNIIDKKLTTRIIVNTQQKYNASIFNKLDSVKTKYSSKILLSLQDTSINKAPLFDEWAALFLHDTTNFIYNNKSITINPKQNIDAQHKIYNLLNSKHETKNQVFARFPVDTTYYTDELKQKMHTIIARYGIEEWQAGVVTAELHRHLGIYAFVGLKMGLRARDYFGAGPDELKVTSYTGNYPPVSCLNDGIQASTGATIGHGLITVKQAEKPMAAADFEYLGQKIRVTLKPEFDNFAKKEIKQLETIYGLSSDQYWDLLRVSTFEIWFGWDRDLIFNIEKL